MSKHNILDEEQGPFKIRTKQKTILDALPGSSRGEAIEFAKDFNTCERTAGTFLKKSCIGKYLQQPEHGCMKI
jgi:hypothetical protein